ncbi:inner membrane protein [Cystoisospora suis]|uniref:Inner membrane protein n=1 Tax=Cystoisospora suis TaxID=483139 RepID=A0A2C6LBU3_9APIC|nr:inner membrane protein [Cystoisospora suis]
MSPSSSPVACCFSSFSLSSSMLRSSHSTSYTRPLHNHLLARRRLSHHSHSSSRGHCVSSPSSSPSSSSLSSHIALPSLSSPFKTASLSSLCSLCNLQPIEKNKLLPPQASSLPEIVYTYRRIRTPSSFLREGKHITSSYLSQQPVLTCLKDVTTTSLYPNITNSADIRSNTTFLLFFHSSSPRQHPGATRWLHTSHPRLSGSVRTPQRKDTDVVSPKETPPATVDRGTSSTRITSENVVKKKGKKKSFFKKCLLGVILLGSSVLAVGIAVDTNDHLKQLLAARQPELAKFCEVNVFPYLRDLRLSLGIPAVTPTPLVTIPQATSASLPPPHAPSSSSSPSLTTSPVLPPSIPLSRTNRELKTSAAAGSGNSENSPSSSVLHMSSTPSSTSDMTVKHNKLLKPGSSTSSSSLSSSVDDDSNDSNQTSENKAGEKDRSLTSGKSVNRTRQEDEEKKRGSRKNDKEEEEEQEQREHHDKEVQERLALEHEKLQMEILLGLFSRLSDAQKRILGFLEGKQLEKMVKKDRMKEGDKHQGDLQSSGDGNNVDKKQCEEERRREKDEEERKGHDQETGDSSPHAAALFSSSPAAAVSSFLPSAEEMVEAEREFSEHLTLPEIRQRLYDLVSQLATSRKYDAIRRAEDLQQLKEKLLVQYDERLHAELEKERERVAASLETSVLQKAQEIKEDADRRVATELRAQSLTADERVAHEREEAARELAGLQGQVLGLHAVVDALSTRAQQAHAVNTLMSVVADIDDALAADRPVLPHLQKLKEASKGDPVLLMAIDSLPREITEATSRPVPTASGLREMIKQKIPAFVKAAFIPPNSGILGHLVAQVFSSFYFLEAYPPPVDPQGAEDPAAYVSAAAAEQSAASHIASRPSRSIMEEEGTAQRKGKGDEDGLLFGLKRNLTLLSWASFYVDKGDLCNALNCLDQLDGLSRSVSREEVHRVRTFLILNQTLQLIKARLACINADILSSNESPHV